VALVGYDDIPMAEFATPPLTTVRSDVAGLGRQAMAMLAALLRGETDVQPRFPPLSAPLVVRASCGALGPYK
jgi:DNA-binding LacI/PurR family transcriptional regulator